MKVIASFSFRKSYEESVGKDHARNGKQLFGRCACINFVADHLIKKN